MAECCENRKFLSLTLISYVWDLINVIKISYITLFILFLLRGKFINYYNYLCARIKNNYTL